MSHLYCIKASNPGLSVFACNSVNMASDEEMFLSFVDGSKIPTPGKANALMEMVRNKDTKKKQGVGEKLRNRLDQLIRRPT